MKIDNRFFKTSALLILYSVCAASLVGAITGTVAWYEYNAKTKISYDGTAVGDGVGIDVGLISDIAISSLVSTYNLEEDTLTMPNKYIYWSNNGAGLTSLAISEYARALGYASNTITATTSREYDIGGDFKLYNAPGYLNNVGSGTLEKDTYQNLNLAFRGKGASLSTIYLEECYVNCNKKLDKAVRVYFNNENSDYSFVFNPSSNQDGETDVCGCLDLNFDGSYDVLGDCEFAYGDYESLTYLDPYQEDIKVGDEQTTYDSTHRKGTKGFSYQAKTASYYGYDSVIGNRMPLNEGTFGGNLVTLDMTVYLEGWDRSCIDSELNTQFNLEMKFAC